MTSDPEAPSSFRVTEQGRPGGVQEGQRRTRTAYRWRALAAVLAIGGVLRVAAVLTVGEVATPRGDEAYYLGQAAAVAAGSGHPGAMRPPAYPLFLAVVARLAGGELQTLRLAQALVGLLAIAIVFDLVVRRFDVRAAFASALLVAAGPDLIHFAHFLWSETVLATLLLATVWTLDRAATSRSSGLVVLAGVLGAAAALTREMALYLTPAFALWLAWQDRGRWRRAALFAGVVALCIVPWSVRNLRVLGHPVLISTSRWYPIADGNLATMDEPVARMRALRQSYNRNPDEIAREADARAVALDAIRRQQPLWIVRKLAFNGYVLFAPTRTQLRRFVDAGWIAPRWTPLAEALLPLETVVYTLALGLGLAGLWLVPDARLKGLVVPLLVVFLTIYVIGNAANRFRVPLLPFLLLYGGPLLAGFGERTRWRVVGVATTLAWFVAVVAIDVFDPPKVRIQYAALALPPGRAVPASATPALGGCDPRLAITRACD